MTSAGQSEKKSDLGPLQALNRVTRVFYAPRAAADEIRAQPNWVFPLLLTLLFSFVTTALLIDRPETKEIFQKTLENSGQKLSDLEKVKVVGALRTASWVIFLAMPVIGNLFIALVLWGAVTLMESKIAFLPVFSYQLHAQMVTLIPRTLGMAWLLGRPGAPATTADVPPPFTLGALLPGLSGSPILHAVAISLDLFGIWYWIVVVAGLAVVAGLPWRRLVVPAVVLWILSVLLPAAYVVLASQA